VTDRKALKRAYKALRPAMGIYAIRCAGTGRQYLGASANLPAIFNRERLQLRTGLHRCEALQHDWRTLGEDAFEFVVLDQLDWPEDSPDYQPQADLDTLLALWFERSNDSATLYATPRGLKPATERLPHV